MTRVVQLSLNTPNHRTQTEIGRSGCKAHIEVQDVAKAGVSHKYHCVPVHAPEVPDGQACMKRQQSSS